MLDRVRRVFRRSTTVAPDRQARDRELVMSLAPARVPHWKQLRYLGAVLSVQDRRRLLISGLTALVSGVIAVGAFAQLHLHQVPKQGGTVTIGLVGAPQTINPVLARAGTVDHDLVKLLFRGLTKLDSDLQVVPDVAESLTVSPDGKSYRIVLRAGELWSDGQPLTANDVKFTYDTVKDAEFRSPYQSIFSSITTEIVDELTLTLSLTQAQPSLPTLLTFGILPQHIWLDASGASFTLAEYNIKPVSNGSWKFQSVSKDRSGLVKGLTFIRSKTGQAPVPYIDKVVTKFYSDRTSATTALQKQSIDILPAVSAEERSALAKVNFSTVPLNQVLGVWFNQSKNEALRTTEVRQALAAVIDRPSLSAAKVLPGVPSLFPVVQGYPGYRSVPLPGADSVRADQLLTRVGWVKGPDGMRTKSGKALAFQFTIPNDPVYVELANALATAWKDLGVKVTIRTIDPTLMAKDSVRPRAYEVLLFGQLYSADGDIYPYWHSSQQADPGFALAIWSNRRADQLLAEQHTSSDQAKRASSLDEFQNIFADQAPAIILAQSQHTLAHAKNVRGIQGLRVAGLADVFGHLQGAYLRTTLAWK